MYPNVFKLSFLSVVILFLSACNISDNVNSSNENLINKVNTIDDHWINYKGISENEKSMIQSQFISYDSNNNYEVSHDTYVSYFNGEHFIKTELYEDTPDTINVVKEADGFILSFNKENKSGMQLTKIE